MAKTAQAPPKRSPMDFPKVDGMHYAMGHYLPADDENGDGPVDKLIEKGYEVAFQKGRRIVLCIPEEEYEAKRQAAMLESENRLLPRHKRKENLVAGAGDTVTISEEGVDRPTEAWGDMVNALPDKNSA